MSVYLPKFSRDMERSSEESRPFAENTMRQGVQLKVAISRSGMIMASGFRFQKEHIVVMLRKKQVTINQTILFQLRFQVRQQRHRPAICAHSARGC